MMNIKTIGLLLGVFLAPALAAPTDLSPEALADKYIITLKKDVESVDSHVNWVKGVQSGRVGTSASGVNKVWSKSFKGYSGQFDEETLEEIRAKDEVRQFRG